MFGGDGSDGFPIFTIYVRSKVGKVRFFFSFFAHSHHFVLSKVAFLEPDASILASLALQTGCEG